MMIITTTADIGNATTTTIDTTTGQFYGIEKDYSSTTITGSTSTDNITREYLLRQ